MSSLFLTYIKSLGRILNIEGAIIIPDSLLAWYGAFRGDAGIIVIGGTGSFIFGYNKGLAAHSSEKGLWTNWHEVPKLAGRHLMIIASKKIKDLISKNKQTLMVRLWEDSFKNHKIFGRFTNKITMDQLLDYIEMSKYGQSKTPLDISEVSYSAKIILKAAKMRDKDAIKLIEDVTETSVLYVAEIAERIELHNKKFKVAYIGSFIGNYFIKKKFKKILRELEPYAEVVKPELKPELGAIKIARNNIRFY